MKLQLIYTTLVLLGAITNAKNIPTMARSLQGTCEDLVEAVEQCEMNNGGKTDLGAMQCYLGFTNTLDFGMQATVSFLYRLQCLNCLCCVSTSKLIGFGI